MPPSPDTSPVPPDPAPTVEVLHGPERWELRPGQSVSFGRGSPCDIRLAHDPIDEHVSRRAGVVEHRGGDVVVRNESATRHLLFSPAREPGRLLPPGETITCHPHREFLVAVDGADGRHYVLQVSAPRQRGARERASRLP